MTSVLKTPTLVKLDICIGNSSCNHFMGINLTLKFLKTLLNLKKRYIRRSTSTNTWQKNHKNINSFADNKYLVSKNKKIKIISGDMIS